MELTAGRLSCMCGRVQTCASANFTSVTLGTGTGAIYDPYGLGRSTGLDAFSPQFIEAIAMPTTATYTLLVGSTGTSIGNATVTLYDVVDASGTIVAGGPPQTVTIGTPGQNAALTFTETAGHRISLDMASTIGGFVCTVVTIAGPDGNPLVSNACVTTQGGFIDVQPPLTATGTYTVTIDPPAKTTGSMTLTLYDVPPDVSGTIVVGGASQAVAMNTPGQNASLTFSGTLGQRISLDMASSIGWLGTCTAVTVKNPDATTLVSNTCVTTQGAFIDVQTLPATGTYTIAINPPGNATGSMTLTLYNVPADVTSTIVAGGAAQTVTIGAPGQNASVTFSGTLGQRVSLDMASSIGWLGTCTAVTVKNPDGTTLVSNTCVNTQGAFIDVQTLPATGTYTIAIFRRAMPPAA